MQRRILLLVTDLQVGGTPTVVRELAVRLRGEEGVEGHVACLDSWAAVAAEIQQRGVEVTALGKGSKRDPGIFWRLLKLIRGGRFDTVMSFLVHANAAAAGASLFCPSVSFLQSIQTTQAWPRWHWKVQGFAARRAKMVVVPTASVAQVAGDWARIAPEKIAVIPNAVEMGEFSQIKRRRALSVLPSPQPSPGLPGEGEEGSGVSGEGEKGDTAGRRIGFIGRLDPVKRIGDLVDAMVLLDRDARLEIYGEGSERARIEAQINRLGLRGRAVLHGAVSGPAAALAAIDVLVLPSVAEGFGLVLIEAMAAGVPVVAANSPGIADVVEDGVNGLLAPARNPAELARTIRRVLEDAELREKLVAAGRNSVREKYSWERVFPMWRRVLGLEQGHAD